MLGQVRAEVLTFPQAHVVQLGDGAGKGVSTQGGHSFLVHGGLGQGRHALQLQQPGDSQIIRRTGHLADRLGSRHIGRRQRRIGFNHAACALGLPDGQVHIHMAANEGLQPLAHAVLQEQKIPGQPHRHVQIAVIHRPQLHRNLPSIALQLTLAVTRHASHGGTPP